MKKEREMKIFITDEDPNGDKKCPSCNWETSVFYGIGKTEVEARSSYIDPEDTNEEWGKGLCGQCLAKLLNEGDYVIIKKEKRR
jgi:hypothetical protein